VSPYSELTEALKGFVAFPFALAGGLWRLWQRWRHVPLNIKNQVRSGAGAAGLALCALCWSQLLALPHGTMILSVAVPLLLLYLLGGAVASRWATFDWFSAFWFAVAALACVAWLIFGKIPELSWLI
jgi:hypothetical protein